MFRISFRLILAALATLTAAGILFWAKADPVPHDATARVKADDFWKAVARPDVARRPTDIVVYPPHMGVQLVTCVGHSAAGAAGVWKYLYVTTLPGQPTVEARLKTMGIIFITPTQDAAWVREGPWIAFSLAAALVVWGWIASLVKFLAVATAKQATPEPISGTAPQVTSADLDKLRALDAELERNLATGAPQVNEGSAASTASGQTTTAAPVVLSGGPLEQIEKPTEENKDYRGEFYPVVKPKEKGFSLVEVLVVIGILGVLIALLLPTLTGARRDANAIVCEANLRSISQGLGIYEVDHHDCIPASYSYSGQTVVNGQQTFTTQVYHHWSFFLYKTGNTPLSAFKCPELDQGGLPPSNTTADNMEPGQIPDEPGAIDEQASRMAYALNEALSPRNKYTAGFQGATRIYQFVKASSVPHSSRVILATEFGNNAARFTAAGGYYIYSHRPIHGFIGLDGTLDMYQLKTSVPFRRLTIADIDPDPATTLPTANSTANRLDWVGRNHGRNQTYPDQRKSNFLYLDGHVECKSIYDTMQPFEWGENFYTLSPNSDLQQP